MILEGKGTPDIIENIIDDNMVDIVNCVNNLSDLKLNINKKIKKRSLKCDIQILFKTGENYKGNVNYQECLDSEFKKCIINVYFPKKYNLSLVIKTLTHELTHIYELYQISEKFDMTKWKWQEALNDIGDFFNTSHLLYFRDILYLSLPQELNARVSSIYFYLKMNSSRGYNKNQVLDILYESMEWQNYKNLMDFDPDQLTIGISNYYGENISISFLIINMLNKKIGIDKRITNIGELNSYFRRLDKYFKKSAIKYKNKLMRVVDKVVDENNKKFEYLTNDPINVDYNEYTKGEQVELRNKKLETLLEYSEFINFNS
jgi:hypothetical protein